MVCIASLGDEAPMMSANTPAAFGAAMEVPDIRQWPPPRQVARMLTPGAAMSTLMEPKFENDAFPSESVVAATPTHSGYPAG